MSKSIKERKAELDETVEKHDDFKRVYENGDVAVYVGIHGRGERKDYLYTSSVHWTSDIVDVRQVPTGPDSFDVKINYGSGGISCDDAEKVAEAMSEIFKHSQKVIQEIKN